MDRPSRWSIRANLLYRFSLAGSYHVPPHQAYLVPGIAYFNLPYMTETYKNKPYSPKTDAETD